MRKNYTRRDALRLIGMTVPGVSVGLSSMLASGCSFEGTRDHYNVVLISIDTLRADHLSCYGYFRNTSPNIDKFAEESLVFENAYSAAPATTPSHMSMFTSVTPKVHGVIPANKGHYKVLPENIKTLPEILAGEGFTNYGYVNNYFQLDAKYGFGRGFPDRFDMSEDRPAGYYGYRKVHLFEEHRYELNENKPVFLFFHTFNVHNSDLNGAWDYIYDGPPKFRDRFLPERKPALFDHSPRKVFYGNEKITAGELEEIVARYDGGILHADSEIAELMELLKEENLYDNSVIVLTADHGEPLGDIGTDNGAPILVGHGGMRNIGLHVPLMIKFPKGFKYNGPISGRIDSQVRTIDIFPTILDTLSIKPPSYIEGESLLDIEGDRGSVAKVYALYGYRISNLNTIFDSPLPDLSEIRNVRIYDLQDDPFESNNLFNEGDPRSLESLEIAKKAHANTISLRQELVTQKQELHPLSEEGIKTLKSLGYLGDS